MVPTCLCTGTAIWHVERSETFTSSTSLLMPHQQHEKNNTVNNTHTQPFNDPLSGTTRVGRYQKKRSPTHTHPDHQTSLINFLRLLWSIASSLLNLRARQSFSTTSLQLLFDHPLSLERSTSHSIISSQSCHLLFAADAHTNTASSAVIPMLCHLYLVSLSAPYLKICLLTPHIHPTIVLIVLHK